MVCFFLGHAWFVWNEHVETIEEGDRIVNIFRPVRCCGRCFELEECHPFGWRKWPAELPEARSLK